MGFFSRGNKRDFWKMKDKKDLSNAGKDIILRHRDKGVLKDEDKDRGIFPIIKK